MLTPASILPHDLLSAVLAASLLLPLTTLAASASAAPTASPAPTPTPTEVAGSPTKAEEGKRLQPGEKAPDLQVEAWVKGEPIKGFEPGKVYLVEFWATWCGPCIGNIPHLNALQKEHSKDGLVVIGFTSPDRQTGKGGLHESNTLPNVRDFVARRGDSMDYHVAFDLPNRETFNRYFGADSAGIPHAFVIDRSGKLVISGHPYYFDEVIESVLAGTWDSATGPKRLAELQAAMRAPDKAKDYTDFKEARLALAARSPTYYERTIYTEILRAIFEGDAEGVNRVGERMIAMAAVGKTGDLGYLINQMVVRDPIKTKAQPYLALAGRLADAYVNATGAKDPSALRLKAEWFAANGDWGAAVETQKRAIVSEIEAGRESLEKRLAEYEEQLKTAKRI